MSGPDQIIHRCCFRQQETNWPREVLTELARFEEPLRLGLYIHCACSHRVRLVLNWIDYLSVARFVGKERRDLNLATLDPYTVCFKLVLPWSKIQQHFNEWDYALELFEGVARSYYSLLYRWDHGGPPAESMGRMSVEELHMKKEK